MIGISGTSGDHSREYLHLEEERYGLGQIRSREQYFNTFGIHPNTRTIEGGLCAFVEGFPSEGAPGSMHALFSPFLRYDNMGIDYSRITYRHITPPKTIPTHIDEKELASLQAILQERVKENNVLKKAEMENSHTTVVD